MPQLLCPVCGERLISEEKRYCCPKGHSFDRSAGGYVNLLIARQSGRLHGDDRLMVRSRRDFLSAGYYEPLKDRVCQLMWESCPQERPDILDSGCGECYYTAALKDYFSARGRMPDIVGIDISKDALKIGDKRRAGLRLAVASAYRLPVGQESCDGILNVFAPFAGEEYLRCLKKGGRLLHVSPDAGHLLELKRAVYDKPYLNDALAPRQPGLEIISEEKLAFPMEIGSNEHIKALFMMTPYAHKTGQRDMERLGGLENLRVSAQFILRIYEKI